MTSVDFIKIAIRLFDNLSDEQIRQFSQLDDLYRFWNSRINVISRKDIDAIYAHHVLHSLAIAAYMKENLPEDYAVARGFSVSEKPLRFLDLGTGGGFPGIPLAILFPRAEFTLCDSIGKKVIVANDVANNIGLQNVTCLHSRVEGISEKYDYVVSRAVASIQTLLPWIKGKYSRGALLLKGGDILDEIYQASVHCGLKNGNVGTWGIDNLLDDEIYSEKFVIFIRNFCI